MAAVDECMSFADGNNCEILDATLSVAARSRALYALVQCRTLDAALMLHRAIPAVADSVLLQHEVLYNIGQYGFQESIPVLAAIATDAAQHEVSRHEAVEALGAIGDASSLAMLAAIRDDKSVLQTLSESADLAIERIALQAKLGGKQKMAEQLGCREFSSVDPAPGFEAEQTDLALLDAALLGDARIDGAAGPVTLFDRYRAMFSLRNLAVDGSQAAAVVLAKALRSDATSALFRHEVAFVLGQLEMPVTAPQLTESLMDTAEHAMVRHEAAEALGSMADDATWGVLRKYAEDPDTLVADSCIVAIEMHEYWSKWKTGAKECDE
jgi:deoxyhypusine monooxygenase